MEVEKVELRKDEIECYMVDQKEKRSGSHDVWYSGQKISSVNTKADMFYACPLVVAFPHIPVNPFFTIFSPKNDVFHQEKHHFFYFLRKNINISYFLKR